MLCKLHYTLPSQREFGPPVECLEFITYEVVARSVASQPKKNAPLAKKLLRSTCISVAIYNISVQDKK